MISCGAFHFTIADVANRYTSPHRARRLANRTWALLRYGSVLLYYCMPGNATISCTSTTYFDIVQRHAPVPPLSGDLVHPLNSVFPGLLALRSWKVGLD